MRKGLTLLALVLAAVVAAGCGNNIDAPSGPDDAVATVDDEKITKAEFDHWLATAARGQQPPGGGEAVVPDPPDFAQCIAQKKEQPAVPGAPKQSDAQLKDQCEQEYEGLRNQVMQFLVSAEWIQQEAEERDIQVDDREVDTQFNDQKDQSFQKESDYREFLRTSGQTESDLKFRVRLDLLSNRVREAVIKDKGNVSDAEIREYYDENKERFGQPELRDLRVIKTDDEQEAEEALAALEDGDRWSDVAKEYSTDETSKAQGGELSGVQKGSQLLPTDVENEAFAAKKGERKGPIETDQGHWIVEVNKITPASQQTLEQATETIRNLLKSEKEQEALDDFIEQFRRDYREQTICADGYTFEECDNHKTEADTGPAYGAEPQGAPPVGPQEAPPAQPAIPQFPGVGPGGVPQTGGAPPTGAPPQGAPPQGAPPQGAPPPQGGAPAP